MKKIKSEILPAVSSESSLRSGWIEVVLVGGDPGPVSTIE